MKLGNYVLRQVAVRVLAASIVILAVLQILDLLDVSQEIIQRDLGFGGILHYTALRLPRMVQQAAPLGVLAGAIFAFMKLAGDSEVAAMRASGVSAYRILGMALPAALAVVAIDLIAVELVAPRTDPALQTWWQDTAPPAPATAPKPRAFRVGADLAVATTTDLTGRTLTAVSIYRRDPAGQLVERIQAPSAVYGHGGWRLDAPHFTRFDAGGVRTSQAAAMTWASAFEPVDVQSLFFGDQMLSAATASRALAGGGAQRPPAYYATRVQRTFSAPLGAVVMLLLAAPIALASFRSSRGAVFVVSSLGAGLLYLVVDGMLSALGESGAMAPFLAAWTAPLIFAALGVTALLRLEG